MSHFFHADLCSLSHWFDIIPQQIRDGTRFFLMTNIITNLEKNSETNRTTRSLAFSLRVLWFSTSLFYLSVTDMTIFHTRWIPLKAGLRPGKYFRPPKKFAPFGRDFSRIWRIFMQFYGVLLHYSPPQAKKIVFCVSKTNSPLISSHFPENFPKISRFF